MNVLVFFNNKGGVGKTTLLYHLAHMFAEMGQAVLVADLDPQANSTSMFLDLDRLEQLWPESDEHPQTIAGVVRPILKGTGDIGDVHVEHIREGLSLIPGDISLSNFEDALSEMWPKCLDRQERALRTTSAFYRAILSASEKIDPDWVLVDVGPNLGALNRSALLLTDYFVVPLGPDLFSLQGLRNLGPKIREWRQTWETIRALNPAVGLPLPEGRMQPLGYVVLQHGIRDRQPPKAYQRWIDRFPHSYAESVLGRQEPEEGRENVSIDPCIATLKHYRSLMPMAMEARKPVFLLKPADGAIGGHLTGVQNAYGDFHDLALAIQSRIASR